MALDGPTATIIASLIAAAVIFVVTSFNVVFRLGKLEKGAEDVEKAMVKLAGDTEKALAKAAADTEKALEKAAADTEKALEKAAADTEKALEKAAADTEKALAVAASDTEKRFDRLEEIIRTEQDATRAEIRRLAEALASHTHDADGTTIFRIPPG
jgi:DNA-directed RNA polymerase alpha subunit